MTRRQVRARTQGMNLIEVFNFLNQYDLTDGVETQESIRDYVCDIVQKRVKVSHILEVMEANSEIELFKVDLGNSMCMPEAIYEVADLLDAVGL